MPDNKRSIFRNVLDQWGGGISLFFSAVHFSHDLNTGLLLGMLPFIRDDMGLNYFQSGLLVSALAITSGISQIFGGWMGDRVKRSTMIMIGLSGVGIASLCVGLTSSYYTLLGVLIVMGVFAGFYHPSAIPALSGFYKDKRGKVLGLHMIGGSIGFGIGPFLGTAIATALNWHMAFIILSLPALCSGLFVALWLKKQGPLDQVSKASLPSSKTSKESGKAPNLAGVLKSVAPMIVLVAVVVFTSGSLLPFFPLLLVDVRHITSAVAAIWLGVIRVVGILGSLAGGWLSDRWNNKKTIMLTLLITGPIMAGLAYFDFGVGLAIAMILFGITFAMRETAVQTYLMGRTPANYQGIIFGIYFGIGQQGQSLLQPVYGTFMDMLGIGQVFGIVALISVTISIISIFVAKKL